MARRSSNRRTAKRQSRMSKGRKIRSASKNTFRQRGGNLNYETLPDFSDDPNVLTKDMLINIVTNRFNQTLDTTMKYNVGRGDGEDGNDYLVEYDEDAYGGMLVQHHPNDYDSYVGENVIVENVTQFWFSKVATNLDHFITLVNSKTAADMIYMNFTEKFQNLYWRSKVKSKGRRTRRRNQRQRRREAAIAAAIAAEADAPSAAAA